MTVRIKRPHSADDEPDSDPDDFWHAQVALPVGSIGANWTWEEPRNIKKRPIGFMADIDALYEEA